LDLGLLEEAPGYAGQDQVAVFLETSQQAQTCPFHRNAYQPDNPQKLFHYPVGLPAKVPPHTRGSTPTLWKSAARVSSGRKTPWWLF